MKIVVADALASVLLREAGEKGFTRRIFALPPLRVLMWMKGLDFTLSFTRSIFRRLRNTLRKGILCRLGRNIEGLCRLAKHCC